MSHRMTPPDKELSQRLLGSVPYSDRFPAGRLLPHLGIIPGDVRSLRELHLVLTPDERSLPGMNLNALVDWVGRVLRDEDLAEAVGTVTRDAGSYVEGCLKVYELVGLRLEQAREVVGLEIG
jgi:hypothetical protein